jgi:hypothetical protein
MIGYTIFIISLATSVACISYSGIAQSKGWPVGMLLHKDASFPKIVAFVTTLWVLVKSFIGAHFEKVGLCIVFNTKKKINFPIASTVRICNRIVT